MITEVKEDMETVISAVVVIPIEDIPIVADTPAEVEKNMKIHIMTKKEEKAAIILVRVKAISTAVQEIIQDTVVPLTEAAKDMKAIECPATVAPITTEEEIEKSIVKPEEGKIVNTPVADITTVMKEDTKTPKIIGMDTKRSGIPTEETSMIDIQEADMMIDLMKDTTKIMQMIKSTITTVDMTKKEAGEREVI